MSLKKQVSVKSDSNRQNKVSIQGEPTEKEAILQTELEAVSAEYEKAKDRVQKLREDNEWLQQEAQRIRVETHEYMCYMDKKLTKRQTAIVTLSDNNKQEIEKIEEQKKHMEHEYDEKKNKLKAKMLEKQCTLEKVQQELDGMQELKELQDTQINRIMELEKEISSKRQENANRVNHLKETFLHEKRKCQLESDKKVQTLKNESNKEAFKCLVEHTNHIKEENRTLRLRLRKLIEDTRALQLHKDELEQQRGQLLREQQYSEDMKELRNVKLHKMLNTEYKLSDKRDSDAT